MRGHYIVDMAADEIAQRRDYLRRRYLELGAGELAAVASFVIALSAIVSTNDLSSQDSQTLWLALAPLEFILLQGAGYWFAARSWVKKTSAPRWFRVLYTFFLWLNPLVLLGGAMAIVVAEHTRMNLVLGGLSVAFGVIEYVNYYWIRLSYPVRTWFTTVTQWRTPRLRLDLQGSMPV